MFKVNDFFCGAGGMGLGFKTAGFQLSGAWDFDKYAVESYKENISSKVKQLNIEEMNWNDVPHADVWTFGFPCQDISIAGMQKGMIKGQTRSGLFYEVMRLLEETEINKEEHLPSIILAENVKSVNKYLPDIKKEYESRGYSMFFTIYNSRHEGVPQNRDRYFILGVHKSIEQQFNFKTQKNSCEPRLPSIFESKINEKYYMVSEKSKSIINQAIGVVLPADFKDPNNNSKIEPIAVLYNRKDGIIKMLEYSPTLSASDWRGLNQNQSKTAVVEGDKIRKLTPREYARLQGFPENYKQVVSDTQFYKQMGNAVTVNVSKAIAEQILVFLKTNLSKLEGDGS